MTHTLDDGAFESGRSACLASGRVSREESFDALFGVFGHYTQNVPIRSMSESVLR